METFREALERNGARDAFSMRLEILLLIPYGFNLIRIEERCKGAFPGKSGGIKKKRNFAKVFWPERANLLIFAAAGLARPAPAELPQDRKVARVGGCSGAM